MFTTVSTSLDTTTLTALLAQCERTGTDLSATIARAVAAWLACDSANNAVPTNAVPTNAVPTNAVAANATAINDTGLCRGYQWKTLYLPEGTLLRSSSLGDCRDAQVIGGRIMHGATSVSPNQFARSCTRSVRNAWKDLLVKRPGDTRFHSASRLRRELAANADAPPLDAKTAKKARRKADRNAGRAARLNAAAQAGAASQPISRPMPSEVSAPTSFLAPSRTVTPGSGWDLPERRKLRYRLEDVAFE